MTRYLCLKSKPIMISITTKRGDKGQTSLRDGSRVSKDDARVELNGELDELNALLGLCKAQTGLQKPFERIACLTEATLSMEQTINDFSAGYCFHFVLPGIDMADAVLHLTRAKVRTCERRLSTLQRHQPVPEALSKYINRLSDFMFCLIEQRPDAQR